MTFFSCNALKCVSMNNQECKVRPAITNINGNEPSFCPNNILVNQCSGNCNNINAPYAKLCVPDVGKDMNIKVSNLMSRLNETRHVSWYDTCTCKCGLDASVGSDKQLWKSDKCRCEFKKLIDEDRFDDGFVSNPSICKCESGKSSDVGKYLDYVNYKCRKRLIEKLFGKYSEDINGIELVYNMTLNDHGKVCNSCSINIVY